MHNFVRQLRTENQAKAYNIRSHNLPQGHIQRQFKTTMRNAHADIAFLNNHNNDALANMHTTKMHQWVMHYTAQGEHSTPYPIPHTSSHAMPATAW